METQETKIGRFDLVRLRTTKNIKYLSALPDEKIDPSGIWSVIAAVDNELLCAKNSAIIRVPVLDVLKISDYSIEHITRNFGKLSQQVENEQEEKRASSSD